MVVRSISTIAAMLCNMPCMHHILRVSLTKQRAGPVSDTLHTDVFTCDPSNTLYLCSVSVCVYRSYGDSTFATFLSI